MIPFFQLDPATLALWVNLDLLSENFADVPWMAEALDGAMMGNDLVLARAVEALPEDKRARAVCILSAIWHEKRHFLDLVLTNYGSFRWRQCFLITAQTPHLIDASMRLNGGKLLVPAEQYSDPLALHEAGLQADDTLISIANDIRARKRIIADDNKPESTRFGLVSVGGEALLEGLAYHFQLASAQNVFGPELARLGVNLNADDANHETKYTWIYKTLQQVGLMKTEQIGDKAFIIQDELPLCLMYAALAMRALGQERGSGAALYQPGSPNHRFASLVVAARDRKQEVDDLPPGFEPAWDFTNRLAKDIFGRTVIEETRADHELTQQTFEGFKDRIPEDFFPLVTSHLELRGRLIDELETNPRNVLHARTYHDGMRGRLKPLPVNCSPNGQLGACPEGADMLFGYRDTEADCPFGTWWWATAPRQWPTQPGSEEFALTNLDRWRGYISYGAPVGKFLESGYLGRVMLGAELMHANASLTNAGIDVIVDAPYSKPEEALSVADYALLMGRETVKCDITSKWLAQEDAVMYSQWDFHSRLDHVRAILSLWTQIYGSETAALHNFQRFWSPWILDSRLALDQPIDEFIHAVETLFNESDGRTPPAH